MRTWSVALSSVFTVAFGASIISCQLLEKCCSWELAVPITRGGRVILVGAAYRGPLTVAAAAQDANTAPNTNM